MNYDTVKGQGVYLPGFVKTGFQDVSEDEAIEFIEDFTHPLIVSLACETPCVDCRECGKRLHPGYYPVQRVDDEFICMDCFT